jgi:uncharacterized peroxidase-related enzyme
MVPVSEATGKLKEMYQLVTTPHGTVDNVMRAHSLRPHTMQGHVVLYRSVLHNPDNVLPLWFLEAVSCCVSMANDCAYSLAHHSANARRLLRKEGWDAARIERAFEALARVQPEDAFSAKHAALLRYAHKLTVSVGKMARDDIDALRAAGCDDGEILEVNQVCAYFNYSNRLLNGLGVTTEGDVIGFYKE